MKDFFNKVGNVFKNYGDVEKGDCVFIFMLCFLELYFVFLGVVKLGVIVGLLFEVFMEGVVCDCLEDSEVKVLIIMFELLECVLLNDLLVLKIVFFVGDNVEEGGKMVVFNLLFE